MRIIVAPDSFKESLTSVEAAAAMAAGIHDVDPAAEVVEVPIADGGEGTALALTPALGGELRTATVTGPTGTPVDAVWGFVPATSTAVVELAEAAGIHLVPVDRRDIWRAGTSGVGELMAHALDAGATTVIVGLGGSVTNDGGLGLLQALGVYVTDRDGTTVTPDAAGMAQADSLDITGMDPRWEDTQVIIAGDVTNPLCGVDGASAVFGLQKGATPQDLGPLDEALRRWVQVLAGGCGGDAGTIRDVPGAGAAGGVGAALLAVLDARMESGAELLLDLVDFRELCRGADLVLTGEGSVDVQTGHGKAPAVVAGSAAQQGVPTVAFGGRVSDSAEDLVPVLFHSVVQVSEPTAPLEESLARGAENLRKHVAEYLRKATEE
ncbi:glycerate kinase [Corynebacterium variabile]|uniref:Glycerate kinase n=1 Tax=Corynebacterium variabile TaxID=1727 RepID=A0A4Y4C0R9_9CORY|nr:glycerate kinase [Corynebacterium variabile]